MKSVSMAAREGGATKAQQTLAFLHELALLVALSAVRASAGRLVGHRIARKFNQ